MNIYIYTHQYLHIYTIIDNIYISTQVCDTGFDGGLQQTFHMEVLSLAENIMYANRSVYYYYYYYYYHHY